MIENPKARELTYAPRGYRGLGRCLRESYSGKAYLFEYYGYTLWIPKKLLVKAEGGYFAPDWAVINAKNFSEKNAR